MESPFSRTLFSAGEIVTGRAARAADQSDPDRNVQFRRWRPDGTVGQDAAMRAWHAADVSPPLSRQRRIAEAEWLRLTQGIAQ